MKVLYFSPMGYFGSNMYIIYSGTEAAVIDPSMKYSSVRSVLEANKLTVKYIIVTHAHFDHILEIDDWVENTEGIVFIGRDDAPALKDPYLNCYRTFLGIEKNYDGPFAMLSDGDRLTLGEDTINILSTPGHSAGSISLFTDGKLFVGDVVFPEGGYGRCDLPGGDLRILFSSISRLLKFNDDTVVYSGHGNESTLKEIKKYRR